MLPRNFIAHRDLPLLAPRLTPFEFNHTRTSISANTAVILPIRSISANTAVILPIRYAYTIEYKYWTFPAEMSAHGDVCIIPDRFKGVIIDGGMMYLMTFRSNEQSATMHREKFDNGIRTMRRILIDDPVSMTSTMILKPAVSARVLNG